MQNYIKAIRLHHWAKNFLIFLAPILAHKIGQKNVLINTSLAFLAFSFTASIGYLINDILDLKADKASKYKSNRPLASGLLSKQNYYSLILILFICSIFTLFYLGKTYALLLSVYLACTLLYSIKLKSILILDVLMLASFYAFRIFAGSIATNTFVSQWLLSFSLFFFFSLALAKRATELINSNSIEGNRRAYQKDDLSIITQLGLTSGLLSILVMALYISSKNVTVLYSNPHYLWTISIVLIYWISRFWILVSRGEIEQDPVVYALKDKTTYFACLLLALVILLAR